MAGLKMQIMYLNRLNIYKLGQYTKLFKKVSCKC